MVDDDKPFLGWFWGLDAKAEPLVLLTLLFCALTAALVAFLQVVAGRSFRSAVWIADALISICTFVAVPVMCTMFVLDVGLFPDQSKRVVATGVVADEAIFLYTAKQISNIPIQVVVEGSTRDRVLMTVHHVISAVVGLDVLLHGVMKWHFCGYLLSEYSTLPLYMLNFLRNNPQLRASKVGTIAWIVNGVLLWLAFLIFRIINYPYFLYLTFMDWEPLGERGGMSVFVRLRILATGVALIVMSVFWFRPIHAGLMKAVRGVLSPQRKDIELQKKE
jgi:hypothetical protein